jgi:hypothetical protein
LIKPTVKAIPIHADIESMFAEIEAGYLDIEHPPGE